MTARDRLVALLNIEPGEGRRLRLLLAQSFCLGLTRLCTQTVAGTLFLVVYDVRDLPWVYVGVALTVPTIGFAYAWLGDRISLPRLTQINLLGVQLAVLAALWVLLVLTPARWPVYALAVWYEVIWAMTSLALWGIAGRLFTLQQGKRLFGLISTGDVVAATLGGLATPLVVGLFGTPSLLLGAMAGLAGAAVLSSVICRTFAAALAAGEGDEGQGERRPPPAPPGTRRYVALLLALAMVSYAGFYFIDNIFYAKVEGRYPDEATLASFLGLFWAAVNVLTLASNLLVGPIFGRWGLRAGLLTLPLLTLVPTALLVAAEAGGSLPVFAFWLAVLINLLDWVFRETVYRSGLLLLYQPLPPARRARVQAIVESIGQPIAQGLTGLALVGFSLLAVGVSGLATTLLVILAGCVALTVVLGRDYRAALVRALARRTLDGGARPVVTAESIALLERGLASQHPGTAIYALDALQELNYPGFPAALVGTLAHPVPAVRAAALELIERLDLRVATSMVGDCAATEADPAVRGAAVRALATLDPGNAVERAAPFLDDPAPAVRLGALIGLLQSGNPAGALAGEAQLIQLLASPAPDERLLAVEALGAAGRPDLAGTLLPLFGDSDRRVRRAALEAAGRIGGPLWPAVLEGLRVPTTRAAADAALVAAGTAALPALGAAFVRAEQDRAWQVHLVRSCGRIGGAGTIALLAGWLDVPDPEVRGEVARALARCGYRARGDEAARIVAGAKDEVAGAARVLAALVDLDDDGAVALLRGALVATLTRRREYLLAWLGCLYDREMLRRVATGLAHRSAEQRAYALEVLDLLIAQELKPIVLPLLGDLPPEGQLARLRPSFPMERLDCAGRLASLGAGMEEWVTPWIHACALDALGRLGLVDMAGTARAALVAPDALVRETAARALARLTNGPGTVVADGGVGMLPTIERVMILKGVPLFAATPDDVLAEVAALLEEVDLPAEAAVFQGGDIGTSMYIIVQGEARVHIGAQVIDRRQAGDVFGEMALLDRELRMASVTAASELRLLRLDQEPFYELLEARGEVARGIIAILCRYVRIARTGAGAVPQVSPGVSADAAGA